MVATPEQAELIRLRLGQLQSENISEPELTEMVQLSRAMIQSFLGSMRGSLSQLCFQQGLSLTDLAYDCVAEAFARDTDHSFKNILNFIGSLRSDLGTIPGRDLTLAYKSFLHRIAEAQLSRLFAQTDPTGAHIVRNIRDAVRQSELFAISRDYRGNVLVPRLVDSLDHLEAFPFPELQHAAGEFIRGARTIPQMLECLYRFLSGQESYRRSIPVVEIALMFKTFFQADFSPAVSVDHEWTSADLSEFEIRRMRQEVENVLKEKILLTYLAKGKVTSDQARALFNALHDIIDEWGEGETQLDSLYDNFNRHWPVPPDAYESEFRSKMEYLLKIARQEFFVRLVRVV